MTRNEKYVQCAMHRVIEGGTVRTTSYIPQQFAKLGKTLKLKDGHDQWSDGWVVDCVGDTVFEGKSVPDYRKAIRNHRKQTGDSAPRLRS
jgi:hypothetical protein